MIAQILQKQGKEWTPSEIETIFDWFVGASLDELIRFAYGFTKSLEMAEDATQDGLTKAFRYLHTYDPGKYAGRQARPFHNWLYTIVAREANRMVRKQLPQMPLSEELDDQLIAHCAEDDSEETKREQHAMLAKNIKTLPPKYTEALELCVVQGLSQLEAARGSQWPCTEGAMKVRKHRAIQQLQQLFLAEGVNQ